MNIPKPSVAAAPLVPPVTVAIGQRMTGTVLMLGAVACYAATDAMVKWLSATLSVIEITFFRSVFTFVPVAFVICRSGGFTSLKTKQRGLHILRASLGTVAMLSFFFAYEQLSLPEVTTLGQTYPILLVALAGPLLGEFPDRREVIATALGFMGVLVVIAPIGSFSLQAWHLLPLLGSLCLAFNLILLRRLSANETQSSLILYTPLLTGLVTGVSLPWCWTTPQGVSSWFLLALMGSVGGTAFYLRNLAYSRVRAAELAPFEYAQVVFASLLSVLVFRAAPSLHLLIGAVVIIVSNLWLIRMQNARRALQPTPR